MNDTFLLAVDKIKEATPNNVVKQLHGIFSQISTMKAESAIAAYETVQFFIQTTPLECKELRTAMRNIQTVIVHRMIAIAVQTPPAQRLAIVTTFESVLTAHIAMVRDAVLEHFSLENYVSCK